VRHRWSHGVKLKLFTLSSAMSLLLFVAVCALWVRSYRSVDDVRRRTIALGGRGSLIAEHGAAHARGRWGVFVGRYGPTPPNAVVRWQLLRTSALGYPVSMDTPMRRLGFGYDSFTGPQSHGWMIWVPYWPVALATGVLPAAWWRAWWRRSLIERRRLKRLCLGCGYDLRGTPAQCPECGRTVAGA
jgi:hypothetical protein